MKFITRELYQSMQTMGLSSDLEKSDWMDRWNRAYGEYAAYFNEIRPRLSASVAAFAERTYHDGVVKAVERPSLSEVVLEIDARKNPWGPQGLFRIRFTGVRDVGGIENLVGEEWLYEEIHLHREGGFEFQVMFWWSDFWIVAEGVEVEEIG